MPIRHSSLATSVKMAVGLGDGLNFIFIILLRLHSFECIAFWFAPLHQVQLIGWKIINSYVWKSGWVYCSEI